MKASHILAFALGVGVGSYATYIYVKEKFAKLTQEEIESVKEVYSKKNVVEPEELVPVEDEKDTISQAKDIIEKSGYTNYAQASKTKKKKDDIEYIKPEEYGDDDDYELISYTYYRDGILTDEMDEVIEHPEIHLGNFQVHFGEFDENSVYVKNNTLKLYYEILMDDRCYMEENTQEE